MIVPIENMTGTRKIGVLDGKAVFRTKGTGKNSEENFLGI